MMIAEEVHTALVFAGRLSFLIFIAALIFRGPRVWLAYVGSLTILFLGVGAFAVISGGQNLFPGGRSLADVGGWPSLVAIFALCYGLAFIEFRARRVGVKTSRRSRIAGILATTMLGAMYLSTYIPLLRASIWFVAPVVLLSAVLGSFVTRNMRQITGCAT